MHVLVFINYWIEKMKGETLKFLNNGLKNLTCCLLILKWLKEHGLQYDHHFAGYFFQRHLRHKYYTEHSVWNTLRLWYCTVSVTPTYNYSFVYSHFHLYRVGNKNRNHSEAVYKCNLLLKQVLNIKYVN